MSFDFHATEKQGIDCKKKTTTNNDDYFLLSSFLLSFYYQHDTSLQCWIILEPLHFISLGFCKADQCYTLSNHYRETGDCVKNSIIAPHSTRLLRITS